MIDSGSSFRTMTRFAACLSVLLLASAPVFAQAPAAAPVTSTASPEIAQFQKIEDSWATAINIRDQYALELVLSPLFVDVAANGDITTRNQQVASLLANEDKTIQLQQKVITVRPLGDIAVANGTYALHHKGPDGKPTDEKGVFTHVFQKVRGGWVCINSQRTAVREDTPGKKQKSPSTADQPFHIPFFSKDKK